MPRPPSFRRAPGLTEAGRDRAVLQHYVLIRYRNSPGDDHVAEFCRRMLALRTSIAGIEHLEIGLDILHDARSWDLILIMRCASNAWTAQRLLVGPLLRSTHRTSIAGSIG